MTCISASIILKPFLAMAHSPTGRLSDRRRHDNTIYYEHVLVICLVYVVLGQAWNLVGGYAGQWSLGHAAFFGLGAYTSTLLLLRANVSPWFGMVAGGLVAAAVACAIAFPCFRLRTHYFAMATLAIGETLRVLFLAFGWTGNVSPLAPPVLGRHAVGRQGPVSRRHPNDGGGHDAPH